MRSQNPFLHPAQRHRTNRWRRWLLTLFLTPLVWLTIHLAVMFYVGANDDLRPADVAVVLGNHVNPDGTPGHVLKARLDRTVSLYRKGVFRNILVSGSTWQEHYDEPAVMFHYLVQHGVASQAILMDKDGLNTRATAISTAQVMQAENWKSVIAISDAFHLLRCRQAFSDAGIKNIRTAHSLRPFDPSDIRNILRDVAGFYRYLFHRYPKPDEYESSLLPASPQPSAATQPESP